MLFAAIGQYQIVTAMIRNSAAQKNPPRVETVYPLFPQTRRREDGPIRRTYEQQVRDEFMRSTFLAQDESFISIKAKDPANRPVTMTEAQEKSVAWLVQLLLPGSVMAIGISVLLRRRK